MGDIRVIFPDFRNEMDGTRYPFADTASLITQDGLQLSLGTFIDATIFAIGNQGRTYLSNVNVQPAEVTLTISDITGQPLCTGIFNLLNPPYNVGLQDAYGRPAGLLVSDPLHLAVFSAWSVGDHAFNLGDSEFVATAVIPTPEIGVRGIQLADGTLLTGDVWLIGDDGVQVTQDTDGTVRIDVIGDPLFVRRQCGQTDQFVPTTFIQTINNCPPDALGNFTITTGTLLAADTVVRVVPTAQGITIGCVGQLLTGGGS